MADPLQPLKPGDTIRAESLNAAFEGARIAKSFVNDGIGTLQGFGTSSVIVRVANDTGEDLDRYSIVQINAPLYDPASNELAFLEEPAFTGSKPSSGTGARFAVLLLPAVKNAIVPACVAGASVVKLDVQSEGDEFAGPGDDMAMMTTSDEGPARIVWKESGTGEKHGLILFPVGGASAGTKRAIVMEAIEQTPDPTADPEEHVYGKIRRPDGDYPDKDENGDPIEPEYDDCSCLELVGLEEDEHKEKILKGTQVEYIGPFLRDNPDHDPEADPPTKEKLPYYRAINTKAVYYSRLESDLEHDGTSTIKVQGPGPDPDEAEFTVHDAVLSSTQMYEAGDPVTVVREDGKLKVIDGSCPVPAPEEDDPDPDPEPEPEG